MSMMPPGGVGRIDHKLIHRSAWKRNSANFALTEFSEVGTSPVLCREPSYVQTGRLRGVAYIRYAYCPRRPPSAVDAQRVGDSGDVGGGRCNVPARVGGRSAVPGPVVGHPTDAEPGCGHEKGLRGRADVWRAAVPENGEPTVRPARACVVHVQRATVAQPQIGLRHRPAGPACEIGYASLSSRSVSARRRARYRRSASVAASSSASR
jgi:hypothetical protein